MATECNTKEAGVIDFIKATPALVSGMSDFYKGYLRYALAAGLVGGGTLGLTASLLKQKNPELEGLKRRQRFYDAQAEEMKNTNWLNDVMAAKRKLESGKMSEEERKALEAKYLALLNK